MSNAAAQWLGTYLAVSVLMGGGFAIFCFGHDKPVRPAFERWFLAVVVFIVATVLSVPWLFAIAVHRCFRKNPQ